jgi:hypothetical protein
MQDVGKNTREKMERKNIAFTRDGMKVQVKEVQDEAYKDRTQRYVLCFSPCLFASTDSDLFPIVSCTTCGTTLPSPHTRADFGIWLAHLHRSQRRVPRSASSMSDLHRF